MDVQRMFDEAREAITIKRVVGEPYEKNGLAVIPVASVRGGGGAGTGDQGEGEEKRTGEGAGFGVMARPVGAFVIKDGDLRWVPAFDLTKVALLGQVVGIVFLLTLRSIVRSRARARIKTA